MSSLRASAASGVLWSALQIWTVRATTAAAFIVLSRQLGPVDFGLVALASAVIAVLSILSDSGLATYVVRAEKVDAKMLSTAFWTSMIIGAVLAGLLALLAVPVASLYDEPGLVPLLHWLGLSIILTALASVPTALLRRELRFKDLAIRGTVATFIGSVVAIVMALNGFGVWSLVAQTLVRGAVSTTIVWTATRWFPRLTWDRRLAGRMLRFGSQLLSIDLLSQARSRGQEFLLGAITGTAGLGLWSVASRLLTIILETGTSVISSVATPVFTKMQGDHDRLFRAYTTSLATASAIIFPMMVLLAVTSRELVPLVLGEQWRVVGPIAQVLALSAAVSSFSYFDRSIFVALDRLRPEMTLVLISTASQLAVVAIFAHQGLMVLAVALLIRNTIVVPLRLVTLHRTTGLPYRTVFPALRVFVVALVMGGVCQLVLTLLPETSDWVEIVVAFALAALLYPLLLRFGAPRVAQDLWGEVQRVIRRKRAARSAVNTRGPAAPTAGDEPLGTDSGQDSAGSVITGRRG